MSHKPWGSCRISIFFLQFNFHFQLTEGKSSFYVVLKNLYDEPIPEVEILWYGNYKVDSERYLESTIPVNNYNVIVHASQHLLPKSLVSSEPMKTPYLLAKHVFLNKPLLCGNLQVLDFNVVL